MGSNLPPGVSVRDIPGNRPIDAFAEQALEEVYAMSVDDFNEKLRTDTAKQALDRLIQAVVENEVENAIDAKYDSYPEED